MTASSEDLDRRTEFAIETARAAGEIGLRYFSARDSLTIESKGHQDLVSEADREVELYIRAAVAAAYPDDAIVGEEHPPVKGRSGFVWVIDPIDGTANFVAGIPAWCVAIACAQDGVAVVGVIHEPSVGEMFHARTGGGAFLNGDPIKVSSSSSLGEGSVGVGSSNRSDAKVVVKLIDLLFSQGGVFYRNASGALMLAYVAAGRLIGYSEAHMNAWDCLAGFVLIEEAGGRYEQPDPRTVLTDGTLVIAGAPGVFEAIRSMSHSAFDR
ncbi:MAG: inositol monophosphatase [bacterium]|nr:inositol monophosphatase [bacterium]MCP4305625.1 inositol monophosphatase [bacterium]